MSYTSTYMKDDTYLSIRSTPGRLNLGSNTPIIDVDFASSSNSNCNARYDGDILTRSGTDDLRSPPAFATTPAPLAQEKHHQTIHNGEQAHSPHPLRHPAGVPGCPPSVSRRLLSHSQPTKRHSHGGK